MTISSAEAEYVAAIAAACQTIWMRRTLSELQHEKNEPNPIFCDNNSAIALSRNHVFHKRSKHIDTRYHFIRELINNNEISMEFCRSENKFADYLQNHWEKNCLRFIGKKLKFVKCNKNIVLQNFVF